MRDSLLLLDAPAVGLHLAVCTATLLARDAAQRHALMPGSAAALAQGLTASLLLAATEPSGSRVDLQLDCGGALRGFLVDADAAGAVRGFSRVSALDRVGARVEAAAPEGPELSRFDPAPLFASGFDERAGRLSILRAAPGMESPHQAAYPFAGADLGAALTLFLRGDRTSGGELALEVLHGRGEPLLAVAGALVWGDEAERLGKPLRQGGLAAALVRAGGQGAHALANELAAVWSAGPLQLVSEVHPRFACRCSRERVVRALRTVGPAELRDMAERDGGASASCDFCGARYRVTADELRALADPA